KNVLDSFSPKLPFGIAQAGKAFRNEITKGNFIFRTLEFNLAEFEYFFNPKKEKWEDQFKYWQDQMWEWTTKTLNINAKNLRWRPHTDEERSHYSKRTEDIEYKFPFGFKELYGLAYRTDFDLKNHTEKSGVDLTYFDQEANERFIPHVIEPTFGISRTFLALLVESYSQDGDRKYLKLDPKLAPYKAAVFPLLANKPDLVKKAKSIYDDLKKDFNVDFDDRGNIGKRYFSQDEIGTPYCITIDFQTLEDDTVTIRDRDNTRQERVKVTEINAFLQKSLS
ncbi:MAG TPA: glycine--tRNA ligase, partial [Patescibacteria group bacterium]